jgi:archaellum biogenesis ATPase FlaH
MTESDAPSKTSLLDQFEVTSAKELLSRKLNELQFIFDPILPSIGLAMLAGPPKAGKSWFCLDIAQKLTDEGHEVYYIAAEDNLRRLKERLQHKTFKFPLKLKIHAGLSQNHPVPRGKDAIRYIEEVYKIHKPNCIIVDTVASVLQPTANTKNYDVTVQEYEALRQLATNLGIVILVVHHTKKQTDYTQTPIEQILGSTGISATVETLMIMQNVNGSMDRSIFVTGKDVEQDEFVLTWNGSGFEFHEDAMTAKLGKSQKEILDYIKQNPECSQTQVVLGLKKDQGRVSKIISQFCEQGLVTKKGKTYTAQ